MEGKYCVEFAKTGRAGCKRCKSPIEKDAVRIGTKTMFQEHESVTWNHSSCFKLPKGMSVDEFLVDLKGFHDLDSEKQVEIRNAIEANANAAKGKRASAPISDGSPAKKSKSESSSGVQAVEGDEIFALYKSKNIDELKDILRWNSQVLKGTKPELIAKCVDGHKNGALPACPEMGCGGRLTADYGIGLVTCNGRFNEERGVYMKCFFKAPLANITDRIPWRNTAPSAEEKAQRQASSTSSAQVSTAGTEKLFGDLDIYSKDGAKQAVGILMKAAREKGINLPKVESEATMRVASIFVSNRELSPGDLLGLLAAEFGTVASSEAKIASSSMGTRCRENEPIVRALSEIAQSMLASGNSNGAMVYRKAVAAIRDLTYEVTDGKALARAKTKVPGIGKKIADLVDVFLKTGTMALSKGKKGSDDDEDDDENEDVIVIDE